MADWEWWFTSEWGRDRILRDRVEDLQASASAASASSARMRSQLARLEGSLEMRLNALSKAFDAYVELGDVREQLLAHVDTGAIRRRVQEAFRAMTQGEQPEPVADDETGYWLTPAANSVIAINAGHRDAEAEAEASARLPEAGLFVVAAAGGLERGPAVVDRVPDLFQGVNALDPARRTLFTAVALGVYPGVLARLAPQFRAALAEVDPADLRRWLTDQAHSADPRDQLDWIGRLLSSDGAPPDLNPGAPTDSSTPSTDAGADLATAVDLRAPQAVVRDRLRAVVVQMIEAGTGSEAELLARAKVLRARIENPGQDDEAAAVREPDPVALVVAVREELLNPAVGPAERAELLDWMRPSLLAVVDQLGVPETRSEPVVTVRTPGGTVDVGPTGPDSTRRAQVLAALATEDPAIRTQLVASGAVTAVAAVLALVFALVGRTGLAVGLLVITVIAGVAAVRSLLARNTRRREQAEDAARAEQAISDAVGRMQDLQRAEREADAALQQSYQRVRGQLEHVPA